MVSRLAYDVGACDGRDTALYLSLGCRVVAIEADPHLAGKLLARFRSEITSGLLTVVNEGVAEQEGELAFYLCPDAPARNTFNRDNLVPTDRVVEIQVHCRPFRSMLAQYGAPYFTKIDIEGSDHVCLSAFTEHNAPKYLSFEAGGGTLRQLSLLNGLGYTRFAIVNQSNFEDIRIPKAGTIAHGAWSVKQLLHTVIDPLLSKDASIGDPGMCKGFSVAYSSGPPPMERKMGWLEFQNACYVWCNLVSSGWPQKTWFDVHAVRESA